MFVTEVIVGLGSGAFGALGAPWITHRFGQTERTAAAKREPYKDILLAASELLGLSSAKGRVLAGNRVMEKTMNARNKLEQAVTAADHVSSFEMRQSVAHFQEASNRSVTALDRIASRDAEPVSLRDLEPSMEAWGEAKAAYERLRDQVQRETRG